MAVASLLPASKNSPKQIVHAFMRTSKATYCQRDHVIASRIFFVR